MKSLTKLLPLCAALMILAGCANTSSCNSCQMHADASPAKAAAAPAAQQAPVKTAAKKLPRYSYHGKGLKLRNKDKTAEA